MKWTERKTYGSPTIRRVAVLPGNYTIDLIFRKDAQSTAKLVNGCTLMETSFPAANIETAQSAAEEKIGEWIADNAARWTSINEMFEKARRDDP